ncbi:hypothetical protein [Escherichia phage ZCEC13]|uniref:Uncharacterized protein n=1 Tax=Escherichia phage ZCEC13 TaxID=2935866 RepID=A0AAE9HK30_9CAUD|nr:hypothetical protein [Escherichia phage ZCEC13]
MFHRVIRTDINTCRCGCGVDHSVNLCHTATNYLMEPNS